MPSLRDRTCIWCGGRPEYTCRITRYRAPNLRQAVGFQLCDWHAGETLERLQKLILEEQGPEMVYLFNELWPG